MTKVVSILVLTACLYVLYIPTQKENVAASASAHYTIYYTDKEIT
jgi:hypothetical protein